MATGSRRLPMFVESNTGKIVVGDGNDYEPIGLPEYTGEGDAQMVVGKTNPVTGVLKNSVGDNVVQELSSESLIVPAARSVWQTLDGQNVWNPAGTVCWQMMLSFPFQFDGLEIEFGNLHTAGYNLQAQVAVSEMDGADDKYPYEGGVAVTTSAPWVNVTSGGSTTIALDARVSATQKSRKLSDFVPISSKTRTDTTDGSSIVMLRLQHGTGDVTRSSYGITNMAAYEAATGRIMRALRVYADVIGNVANAASLVALFDFYGVDFSIRFYMRDRNIRTIYIAGDSTSTDYRNTAATKLQTYGERAAASLVAAGRPATAYCEGWVGQTTTQYLARALQQIPILKPQYAVFAPHSINNGHMTEALRRTARQNAMRFLACCYENRVVPILTTPFPSITYNNAVTASYRADLVAMCQSGALLLDIGRICGNADDPEAAIHWKDGYGFDEDHPTEVAHAAVGAALAALIS